MITIQLSGGFLDIYKTDIELSWKTVRFSDAIQDPYSNDFTLPKTQNNIALLDACGLLDSYQQPLGTQIAPCAYVVGSHTINAYIQVVSVDDETITICLFEKTIPEELLNVKISELLRDTSDNIFIWNPNTQSKYPAWFKKYQYSTTNGVNTKYAQLHPSTDLNNVIQRINSIANIQIPESANTHYAIATKKTVSPHNTEQVVEGHWTSDSGNFAVLSGGQHVTNDLEFSYTPDQTTITFNRDCKIRGDIYFSWKKKSTVTNNFYLMICRYRANTPTYAPAYTIQSSQYASHVTWDVFQTTIKAGDTIRVQCDNLNKYDLLNFVIKFTITDYAINDDDYGTELKYIGRLPRLKCWSDNGMFIRGGGSWQSQASSNGGYAYLWCDGKVGGYYYHYTGSPNTLYPQYITLPDCSFAYFQYWCNLPEISVKELMFGLCWLDGKKIVNGFEHNGYMLYPKVTYEDCNESAVIDGRITNTVVSSDTVGQANYILQNGENHADEQPVSTIPNQWLEREKDLHKSPFTFAPWKYGYWYCIHQYEDFSHEEGSEEYKCKFIDVDGLALANLGSESTMLYRYSLNTMGFERINQSVEVSIETYDDCKTLDFVYLQGRKFMVIEGSRNLETGFTELRCLLCPMFADEITPEHQAPQPAEEQWGDHDEGYYPDPNDDFDNGDTNPAYDNWNPWYDIGNEPVNPPTGDDQNNGDYDWEGDNDPWVHDPYDWG